MTRSSGFRPEIQGLRTVAALLVAIYHIWFGRVSGGVDVFFVVSGFLITGSLVREALRSDRIDVSAYLSRIARRILPSAFLVLGATTVGVLLVVSQVHWRDIFGDLVASASYVANWHHALATTDYLNRGEFQSPVLHYWALAIQAQFYLAWPLLVIAVMLLSRRLKVGLPSAMGVVLVVLVGVSFSFAVAGVASDQAFTYFDTRARVWQFALGGLMALVAHRVSVPAALRWVLGWGGLIAIVGTGAVLEVGATFPGFAALGPTLGAVAVLMAGDGRSEPRGAARFLGARPFVMFGDVSYGFFLWHWPLFILVRYQLGVDQLSIAQGALLLGVSLLLAVLTTRWVERPFERRRRDPAWLRLGRREGMAFAAVPLLLITGNHSLSYAMSEDPPVTPAAVDLLEFEPADVLSGYAQSRERESMPKQPDASVLGTNPGALAFGTEPGWQFGNDGRIAPAPYNARADAYEPTQIGCQQRDGGSSELILCSFGVEGAGTSVALVGGSHSGHYFGAFEVLAEEHDWELLTALKSGCPVTADAARDACADWNDRLLEWLLERRPDVVVLTSTVTRRLPEHVPDGFVTRWRELEDGGIDVVAIRDTPWLPFDAPLCVDEHGPQSSECIVPRDQVLADDDPVADLREQMPGVGFVDLTANVCDDEVCPAVAGGVIVYNDSNHFSATYARTLANPLDRQLRQVAPHLYAGASLAVHR